jgi:transcription initiation factor TFIID subunit TAF12
MSASQVVHPEAFEDQEIQELLDDATLDYLTRTVKVACAIAKRAGTDEIDAGIMALAIKYMDKYKK